MSYEVYVEKVDNSTLMVYSNEPCVHEELYERFKVPDPSFKPSRFSKFDGLVRLYDRDNGTLPIGLLPKLMKFLKLYKATYDKAFNNVRKITDEELQEWVDSLNLPFELYDYQFEIIRDFVKFRRLTALADTGAGKSLVIYVIVRFLLEINDGCVLILVPNILLVNQILQDFEKYGWTEAKTYCQQIFQGNTKSIRKRCVISTWQSLQDMSSDYFEQFTGVICDEVHGASAKKQTKIVKNCRNATDKLGLTGTLRGTELHEYQVEGLFGISKTYVETQRLKELGQAAETQIYMVNLKYPRIDNIRMAKLDYEGQIQYLLNHQSRMEMIAKSIISQSDMGENCLVIFERVEDGVYKMVEKLTEMGYVDRIRVIESSVKLEERDRIKAEIEESKGLILIATWGTMSTGVSINNLHNLFLCSNTKGLIRVLQSLGRLLRVHASKKIAKIIDYVDDTRTSISSRSVFVEHAKERYKFYSMKKHPIKIKSKPLVGSLGKDTFEGIWRDSERRKESKSGSL